MSGVEPDEAEKIALLAEILGWQVRPDGRGAAANNQAAPAGEGATGTPARLVLRQAGGLIQVETDDPDVRLQLARQGLDRLVSPVPLMALEQLLTFAS